MKDDSKSFILKDCDDSVGGRNDAKLSSEIESLKVRN